MFKTNKVILIFFLFCSLAVCLFSVDQYYSLFARISDPGGTPIEDVSVAYRINGSEWEYLECVSWWSQDEFQLLGRGYGHRGKRVNYYAMDFLTNPYRYEEVTELEFRFYKLGYDPVYKTLTVRHNYFRGEVDIYIPAEMWPRD